MTKLPKVYCCRCQREVRLIKGIATFLCQKCGAMFLPSQIADVADKELAKQVTALTDWPSQPAA
jgi:hypothetical protein